MRVPHHHFALLIHPLLSVYKVMALAQPAQCRSMQCQRDMPLLSFERGETFAQLQVRLSTTAEQISQTFVSTRTCLLGCGWRQRSRGGCDVRAATPSRGGLCSSGHPRGLRSFCSLSPEGWSTMLPSGLRGC